MNPFLGALSGCAFIAWSKLLAIRTCHRHGRRGGHVGVACQPVPELLNARRDLGHVPEPVDYLESIHRLTAPLIFQTASRRTGRSRRWRYPSCQGLSSAITSRAAARMGDHRLAKLRRLDHAAIVDVRGKGLFVGVEIDPAFANVRGVCEDLLELGRLTKDTHGTVIWPAPALAIERAARCRGRDARSRARARRGEESDRAMSSAHRVRSQRNWSRSKASAATPDIASRASRVLRRSSRRTTTFESAKPTTIGTISDAPSFSSLAPRARRSTRSRPPRRRRQWSPAAGEVRSPGRRGPSAAPRPT
jgi:hypothetical protein